MFNLVSTKITSKPFLQRCFPAGQPQYILVHGVAPPHLQDLAQIPLLNFMCFLSAHLSNLSRSLWIAAQHSIWYTSNSSRFVIICKLAWGAFCPIIHINNEDAEEDWIQYWPLGTLLVSGLHLDFLPLMTTLFSPSHCQLNQPILLQCV